MSCGTTVHWLFKIGLIFIFASAQMFSDFLLFHQNWKRCVCNIIEHLSLFCRMLCLLTFWTDFEWYVWISRNLVDGKLNYRDFVWFLISEEDKRHPRRLVILCSALLLFVFKFWWLVDSGDKLWTAFWLIK